MLLVAIGALALVWLLVGLVCVALCRSAAAGDRWMPTASDEAFGGQKRFERTLHSVA